MGSELATVTVSNVHKAFRLPNGTLRSALRGVSLGLKGNCFTSLIGPNGCGKSTLLGVIAGILSSDSGRVDYTGLTNSQPRIGYVWQDYRASLLPWLSAAENIAFPLRLKEECKEKRVAVAAEMMREFMPGVEPSKPCYELSGGQQQMLCLLRSAVSKPDVMLFDEPFSALDQNRRWSMATYVERIWASTRCPALFVSHDVDEAVLLADEVLLMRQDGVIEDSVKNPLPRPRSQDMLTNRQHVECRDKVIAFFLSQESSEQAGAIPGFMTNEG